MSADRPIDLSVDESSDDSDAESNNSPSAAVEAAGAEEGAAAPARASGPTMAETVARALEQPRASAQQVLVPRVVVPRKTVAGRRGPPRISMASRTARAGGAVSGRFASYEYEWHVRSFRPERAAGRQGFDRYTEIEAEHTNGSVTEVARVFSTGVAQVDGYSRLEQVYQVLDSHNLGSFVNASQRVQWLANRMVEVRDIRAKVMLMGPSRGATQQQRLRELDSEEVQLNHRLDWYRSVGMIANWLENAPPDYLGMESKATEMDKTVEGEGSNGGGKPKAW